MKELDPSASQLAAFGARIRGSRTARGWKQRDLASQMGFSPTQISHVETGRKMASWRFARSADAAFGFEGTDESFERELGKMKHGVLFEGFPQYVAYEARAIEIRIFNAGLIPGLLQTPAYVAAVEAGVVKRGASTPDQAEERINLLAERQAALVRPTPPTVIAVLDESCLRRPVGGPEVMDRQFAHLIAFAEQPNTILQVAPYALGEHCPFNRMTILLTLPDHSVVSYVESQIQGHLSREIASVRPLMRAYHQLQGASLSQADSVDMIEQMRKGTQ